MLNKKGERELAYVVKIDSIEPIDGADRVEVACVGGWRVMVGMGQFAPGDLAIYFEIDSKLPATEVFSKFEKYDYKVKTQRYFKGKVISQGLLMGAEELGWILTRDMNGRLCIITNEDFTIAKAYHEGDFLTKELGVTYYEPTDNERKAADPMRKYKRMAGRHSRLFQKPLIKWIYKRMWGKKLLFFFLGQQKDTVSDAYPTWLYHSNEERIQNILFVLDDKTPRIVTEKIDGTNAAYALIKNGDGSRAFYICSHKRVLEEDDKTARRHYDMADKYNIEYALNQLMDKYDCEWISLHGEIYGRGVQKRGYQDEKKFAGFDLTFSNQGRLGTIEAMEIMKEFDIPWVPIVDANYVLPDTVEEILEYAASQPSMVDGGIREGVVIRSKDGRYSFKVVSNKYLLKYR